MRKFLNCNVIDVLNVFMKINTEHYQSDFEYDKVIIKDAANSPDPLDKTLLWLSRPNGTWCFREQNAYIKDSDSYNSWIFYDEQTRDNIIAFAIEIRGMEGKNVIGDLYELDYHWHCRKLKEQALPPKTAELDYSDTIKTISFEDYLEHNFNSTGLQAIHLKPADMQDLEDLLSTVKTARHINDYYSKHTLRGLLNSLTTPAPPSAGVEM